MNRPHESELHAFVDGLLPPARKAEVEAWLSEHGEDAQAVRDWRMQNDALRRVYAGYEQASRQDRVLEKLPAPGWHGRGKYVVAVLASAAIGGVFGFLAREALPEPADTSTFLPRHAAIAHIVYTPEVRHPVEVGADQEAHLVQWLSRRLGGQLVIPDLNSAGFRLIGGRLLPATNGPAAQFMYEDKSGTRLTLYVRGDAPAEETAFRYADEGRIGVFYWMDGGFGYALAGTLGRDALLRIARIAHPQLGKR